MRPRPLPPVRLAALSTLFALSVVLASSGKARADEPPATSPAGEPPAPVPPPGPSTDPAPPPLPPPAAPTPPSVLPAASEPASEERSPEPMSEGRAIVAAWNTGFQWGLSPGVVFSQGNAGFALGLRLGYGFDTNFVIIVPGARGSIFFTDPNVYLGMPVLKLVYPINRFAPFVEGGGGVGHLAGTGGGTGAALFVGGGFMIHFTRSFALGAEVNYQVITGTSFRGVGVGPIIAFAF